MIKLVTSYFYAFVAIFRTLTFVRIKNYTTSLLDWFLSSVFKKSFFKIFPWFLSVEPADFCQLACPECPVGILKKNKGLQLNPEIFSKLLQEIENKVMHIQFFFQGEPLLNKHLPELIQLARKRKIFTSLSTNAQALTKQKAYKLVEAGLDKLIVSVDGATQTTYEQYRVNASLNRALEGVKWIQHWKTELKRNYPLIEFQMVVFRTNEHEMAAMKKLSKTYQVDNLVFKSAQITDINNAENMVPKNSKFARYKKSKSGHWKLKKKINNRCYRLWSGGVVRANGDVLPCCFDKHANFKFGSIRNNTFQTVFSGSNAIAFRNSILKNRKQHHICTNCNM